MPAAVQWQAASGDIGVIHQKADGLVDDIRSGLDAQCRFVQRARAVVGIVLGVKHDQRRCNGVDLDLWCQARGEGARLLAHAALPRAPQRSRDRRQVREAEDGEKAVRRLLLLQILRASR